MAATHPSQYDSSNLTSSNVSYNFWFWIPSTGAARVTNDPDTDYSEGGNYDDRANNIEDPFD